MSSTRRNFLLDSLAVAGSASLVAAAGSAGARTQAAGTVAGGSAAHITLATPPSVRRGDMLYRTLGRTGEQVSLIGLGGAHIGSQPTEDESIRLIRGAIDRGITFLDNCWDYNDGRSEVRMGKALRDGYRQKIFLMTKIDGRTAAAAESQINESLGRLQTDHIDLLQFHEIIRFEDPDRIFAPGGALEAVLAAKTAGKVRHIGFTGHKDPLVHLRMLEIADAHGFYFDAVQMPLNVLDAHFRSFGQTVLPVLLEKQIGVLGMKTFGDHAILDHVLKNHLATPIEMLHYSMNLPTSVVITGMDRPEILDQAIEAARTFKPLPREQVAALLQRVRPAALDGRLERFKTSAHFDGTAHNPQWLG